MFTFLIFSYVILYIFPPSLIFIIDILLMFSLKVKSIEIDLAALFC